ncbi:MAG: NUDIX domain-containing protein [Bradyrhizobium sp.]|nr:NUDIX domain-containing protein [Bradyrhizobium sp.]
MPPIRIAAALIDDGAGRMLLVRKAGSRAYMQAGGKIEPGEAPLDALRRELAEEIGLEIADAPWLGRFQAPAANEPGRIVEAELSGTNMTHHRTFAWDNQAPIRATLCWTDPPGPANSRSRR